jgi:hypothetical protein
MPNTTWKSFERRLARGYGQERSPGEHGPDFLMLLGAITFRAEAKKRSSRSGLKMVFDWLEDRDILFIGVKYKRDNDALVVVRKNTFDVLWALASETSEVAELAAAVFTPERLRQLSAKD